MDGHKPPSTLIGVQALAKRELLYEIEIMAVVSGTRVKRASLREYKSSGDLGMGKVTSMSSYNGMLMGGIRLTCMRISCSPFAAWEWGHVFHRRYNGPLLEVDQTCSIGRMVEPLRCTY